ncbi:MAG: AAA family ATPase [Pseudomonadota bacterium]
MATAVPELSVRNYRSIRDLTLELAPLTVVVGENGVGKSNLYRSLELLHAAATGDLSRMLAREGGMPSAFWAGAPWTDEAARETAARASRRGPRRIALSARFDRLDYALELGLPGPTDAALALDPVVKLERLRAFGPKRPAVIAERKGPSLFARDETGRPQEVRRDLWLFETALASVSEPQRHPELDQVRRGLTAMRFHHQVRTDAAAPLRQPQPAIMTPSVASDGLDWAAALASLAAVEQDGFGESAAARAVAEAFPGGALEIAEPMSGAVAVLLHMDAFPRPFAAPELSDGTLRFLVLVAALTALAPPPFLALNEPEASLHPRLLPVLADLIGAAAARGQILVVTHAEALAERLSIEHGARRVRLVKEKGETRVAEIG